MKQFSMLQVAVIGSSLVVFLLLFFAPKNYSVAKATEMKATEEDAGVRDQIEKMKEELGPEARVQVDGLERELAAASSTEDKTRWLDSLVRFWDNEMRPAISAVYIEDKSKLTGRAEDWLETGNRYLAITSFLKEEDRPWAYTRAQMAYDEVLAIDSTNTDALISKGICIVNAGVEAPMTGIALVKGVLEKDPTNLRAIVELGHFSVTSGQFPKAIERYQEALSVRPDFYEAYLYLGETYAMTGDLGQAEKYLLKYRETQESPEVQWQIDNRIRELKELIKP